MFDTLSRRIRHYGAYRTTVRELSRLSSRQLADIGVNPGAIDEVARAGR